MFPSYSMFFFALVVDSLIFPSPPAKSVDVWVLRIPETADEMGSSGFSFASVLPPTGEDQPLTWNHQLIQNLSTEVWQ